MRRSGIVNTQTQITDAIKSLLKDGLSISRINNNHFTDSYIVTNSDNKILASYGAGLLEYQLKLNEIEKEVKCGHINLFK